MRRRASGSETSRRTLRLTSAKASSNDTGLLPLTRLHRRFLITFVRQIVDVGVALTEDTGTKQRAKKDSIDAAGPGDGL